MKHGWQQILVLCQEKVIEVSGGIPGVSRGLGLLEKPRGQHGSGPSALDGKGSTSQHQHPRKKWVVNILQPWLTCRTGDAKSFSWFQPSASSVSAGVLNHGFRALYLYLESLKPSGELCEKPYRVTQIQSPLGKPSHGTFLKVSERVLTGFEIYTLKRQETSSSSLTATEYTHHVQASHTTLITYYTHHTVCAHHMYMTPCAHRHTR